MTTSARWHGPRAFCSSPPGRRTATLSTLAMSVRCPFRPVWQRFTGSSFIGLVAKRRDGTRQDGGYEHGKIKFDIPLQCVLEDADVDSPFLQALNAANASGASVTIERLKNSLSFVALANTDDELMDHTAEAILMGSAFEQLFGIQGQFKKRQLRDAFGGMFAPYGNVTAEAAQATPARNGITFEGHTKRHKDNGGYIRPG